MKHLSILFLSCLLFCSPFYLHAQSFTVAHDTVIYNWPGGTATQNVEDAVINLSTIITDSVTVKWKVIDSDFPADWVANTGICDNGICYTLAGLWPSGSTQTSKPYPNGPGDFHLQTNLSVTTSVHGCHFVRVRMHNSTIVTDSATETYIVCNSNVGVTTIKLTDEVVLYPNPAGNELNIVYDANADIKNIAVYNIIGKLMTFYKVTGNNSANLNLESMPSGIYFVRLVNTLGQIVVTRKFTKQ